MARVAAMRKPNHAGSVLDATAIHEATKMLGIDQPLSVRWGGDDEMPWARVNGFHGLYSDGHRIVLSPVESAGQVDETLWHELTHAYQRERDGNEEAQIRYEHANATLGYANNPYEVQADRVAARFAREYPLTKRST